MLLKNNPYLLYFVVFLFIIMLDTCSVDTFINNKKNHIVGIFFDNKSNYNLLSNIKSSSFNSATLLSNQVIDKNTPDDFNKVKSISYTYSKIYKKQYKTNGKNNFYLNSNLNQAGSYSHHNENSILPVLEFENLALANIKSSFLRRSNEDIAKKNIKNDVNNLYSGLLIVNNSSSTNVFEDDTYQKAGFDPGNDPTTDPIPVGEGYHFLLLLISGYTILKLKKQTQVILILI